MAANAGSCIRMHCKDRHGFAGITRICVIPNGLRLSEQFPVRQATRDRFPVRLRCSCSFLSADLRISAHTKAEYPHGYPHDLSFLYAFELPAPSRLFSGGKAKLSRSNRSGTLIILFSGYCFCQIAHSYAVFSVIISTFPPTGGSRRRPDWSSFPRPPG